MKNKKAKTTTVLLFITAAFIAASFVACKTTQKIAYEFPAAMAPPIQAQFATLANKGAVLYGINCAGCHNPTIRGRKVIPDFSPEQLTGYELRVSNPQHELAMPDTKVTAEELAAISTFLTYKKKSGVLLKNVLPGRVANPAPVKG